MNKPVLIVVVVLAVVVLLFAVGVGAGVRNDQGDGSPLVDLLGTFVGDAADADVATMSTSCPGLDAKPRVLTILASRSCSISVAKSAARIRLVRLSNAQPIVVDAPGPERNLDSIEKRVARTTPDDPLKIAVGRNGAGDPSADDKKNPIVIRCPGPGPCSVTVLNGS